MEKVNEPRNAGRIDGIKPESIDFESRTDDEPVSLAIKVGDVVFTDAGPEKNGQIAVTLRFLNVGNVRRFARRAAGHDYTISAHELNRFGCFAQAYIRGDGVS